MMYCSKDVLFGILIPFNSFYLFYSDQLSGYVILPAAKTTELHPVYGKSISVLIQAAQSVSVILHEKPQATSARYRFKIFYDSGVSGIYRSTGGNNEILQHSQSTPNALATGQSRPFWIDFRSSNLVLGSGGEVLLQWNDQSPISISYVSFTADDTQSTTITMINRQKESELDFLSLPGMLGCLV